MDEDVTHVSSDDKRAAVAELGEGARAFYDGIMANNPSPRVREAVEQVFAEAASAHRIKASRSGSRRLGRMARGR